MTNSPADAPRRRSTRRAVLKTGAHAAWTIPAIQVVSAVTEYAAASGVPARHATLSLKASYTLQGHSATGTVTVQNIGDAAARTPTVTFSGAGIDYSKPFTATGANWGTPTRIGDSWVVQLTGDLIAGDTTAPLQVTFTAGSKAGAKSDQKYEITTAATASKANPTDGDVVGALPDVSRI